MTCPKCGTPLECGGGLSAHPDNWSCPKCDLEAAGKEAAKANEFFAVALHPDGTLTDMAEFATKEAEMLSRYRNLARVIASWKASTPTREVFPVIKGAQALLAEDGLWPPQPTQQGPGT